MRITDLMPWSNGGRGRQMQAGQGSRDVSQSDPVSELQTSINRAFDDFWSMLASPMGLGGQTEAGLPVRVDVEDTANEVIVNAELPGVDEDDIDISVASSGLTIRAERREERRVEEDDFLLRERRFGMFERTLPLPSGVDPDGAEASFRNGVLTVRIPKTKDAESGVKHVSAKSS